MKDLCPKTPNCRLFNGEILKREGAAETYKNLFCRSKEKYHQCKRYIVSEKVGDCADFIMPNSSLSIEDIIDRMKKEGLI